MTESNSKSKVCDVCGSGRGVRLYRNLNGKPVNKNLCYKHFNQLNRFGEFLDNNPRTINDQNEIHDMGDGTALIDLYDTSGNVIAQTVVDIEDVDRVKNMRWRTSVKRHKVYVISGSGQRQVYLARYLMDYDGPLEVDHRDGDSLNNRKKNLRIVTRTENMHNLCAKDTSKTQIRGVSYAKRGQVYAVNFKMGDMRLYFKSFDTLPEAAYIRLLCERKFLGQFQNPVSAQNAEAQAARLSDEQKELLDAYFIKKMEAVINEDSETSRRTA